MKNLSVVVIYPNFKIFELKTDSCIQATNDISENTLLFEVGSEVILNSKLNKYYKDFQNKNWCYFNYFGFNLFEHNKNLA